MVRRRGARAGTRWAERLQPPRLYGAVPGIPDLSFELEYASERNGDALDSNAWTAQGAYELSDVTWKPKLLVSLCVLPGRRPGDDGNEAFDPLFLGFHDWGYWWQGEIAGEYFLSNSNLKSHLVRVHVTPNEAVSGGLLFFKFGLDHPQAFGPDVTETDVAYRNRRLHGLESELELHHQLVGAYADPGKAVQQSTGRTKNFAYGMVYLGYF